MTRQNSADVLYVLQGILTPSAEILAEKTAMLPIGMGSYMPRAGAYIFGIKIQVIDKRGKM